MLQSMVSQRVAYNSETEKHQIMTHIFPTSRVLKILHLDLDIQLLEKV